MHIPAPIPPQMPGRLRVYALRVFVHAERRITGTPPCAHLGLAPFNSEPPDNRSLTQASNPLGYLSWEEKRTGETRGRNSRFPRKLSINLPLFAWAGFPLCPAPWISPPRSSGPHGRTRRLAHPPRAARAATCLSRASPASDPQELTNPVLLANHPLRNVGLANAGQECRMPHAACPTRSPGTPGPKSGY